MSKFLTIFLSTFLILNAQANHSLSFDGVDDEIIVEPLNHSDDITNITFMCWVKSNELNTNEDYILSSWTSNSTRDWGLRINTNGGPSHIWTELKIDGSYQTLGADYDNFSVSTDIYYHFAMTYDGSYIKLYQDGILAGSKEVSGSLDLNPNDIKIGECDTPCDNANWSGNIDEFSIWSEALSDEQIQYYMTNSPTNNEELVAYWNFNDGEGSTLTDLSGNDNDGTIYGATWSTDVPIPTPLNIFYVKKEDGANPFDEENQDRLTDNIWISRGSWGPLLNMYYSGMDSDDGDYGTNGDPFYTQWGFGYTEDVAPGDYHGFKGVLYDSIEDHLQDIVGNPLSLQVMNLDDYVKPEDVTLFIKNTNNDTDDDDQLSEQYQDRISEEVWIARDEYGGLFNIYPNYAEDAGVDHNEGEDYLSWGPGRTSDNPIYFDHFVSMKQAYDPHDYDNGLVGKVVSMKSYTSKNIIDPFPDNVVYFEKEDYADPNLEENQDRLCDNVWLSSNNRRYNPLLNMTTDYVASGGDQLQYSSSNGSPFFTEWAVGFTESVSDNQYKAFGYAFDDWDRIVGTPFSLKVTNLESYVKPDDVIYLNVEPGYDYSLEQNQDRISDEVWIGRNGGGGLENLASGGSTLYWAKGRSADLTDTDYTDWQDMKRSGNERKVVGEVISLKTEIEGEVVYFDLYMTNWAPGRSTSGSDAFGFYRGNIDSYLPSDAAIYEYYDLIFTKYNAQNDGGGFAYLRGTPGTVPSSIFEYENEVHYDLFIDNWGSNNSNKGAFSYHRGAPDSYLPIDAAFYDYHDIIFTEWTSGGDGGGFAYTRTDLQMAAEPIAPVLVTSELPNAIEDETYSMQLMGTDENGDDFSFSLGVAPDWISITSNGYLEGTPENNDVGVDINIEIILTDQTLSSSYNLQVTVENTNDQPIVLNPFENLVLNEDGESHTINLETIFADLDVFDELTFHVEGFVSFSKEDNSDYTLEENQDRVNENVWLTRGDNSLIFNIAQEDSYQGGVSPSGTEWSYGYAGGDLVFQDFKSAVDNSPPSSVGKPIVMHTITDDIYHNMLIHHWTMGGGGGVAWTRSEPSMNATLITPEINDGSLILHLHPNASGYVQLTVHASDQDGTSTSSDLTIMVNGVNDDPNSFALLSPSEGSVISTLNPVLIWDQATDPDDMLINGTLTYDVEEYEIYIHSQDIFEGVDPIHVSSSSYTIQNNLEEDLLYYWKVVAKDNNGGQTESAVSTFWTNSENSAPSEFSLLTPESDATADVIPTFSWTASTDADLGDMISYRLTYQSSLENIVYVETGSDLTYTPEVELMDNTEYVWHVVATDESGATYTAPLQSFSVNTENDLPGDFTTLVPELGSMVTDLTPTLMWEEPTDADDASSASIGVTPDLTSQFSTNTLSRNSRYVVSYDVYINIEDRFDGVTPVTVSETHYTPEVDLSEDVMYYWKVVATDEDGGQTESNMSSFWTNSENSVPGNFSLVEPQDNAVLNIFNPPFCWEEATDEDINDEIHYVIELGHHIDSLDVIYNGPFMESCFFETMGLVDDNTIYYWRVLAIDNNGAVTVNDGDFNTFTINTENDLPGDFTTLTPELGSMVTDLTPTLMWEEPTDADDASSVSGITNPFSSLRSIPDTPSRNSRYIVSYDVYVNAEDVFDGVTPVTVSETHYTPEVDLSEDVMYYWKVIATDEDGGQTESNVSSFWTNSENSVPSELVLLTPESEVETGLNPTFSWTASTDADLEDIISYRLIYQSSLEDIVHVETGLDLTYTPEVELMDNTEYVWHVVATDRSGATYTTPLQSFSVNTENNLPDGLVLISPLNDSYTSDFNQLLFWSPATDLDNDIIGYDVILNGEWFATTSNNYVNLYGLEEDMVYEWSVVAMDNNGGETQSGTWRFTLNAINEPPSEFTVLEPINNAVLNIFNPPFCWEEATDIDTNDELSYTIELGTHIDSLSIIYSGPYLETCYFETMGLVEDNSIYYWKVIAYDVSGATTENIGGYSSFIINTMNDEPTVSELIAPLNESIQTELSPNFYWTESHDVDPLDHVSYSISWWRMDDMEVQSVTLDSNGVTPEEDLMDNSMYGWSVEAMDMNEATTLTETAYFYTDAFPEAPRDFITVAPENESSGLATEVTFVWNATTDPDPIETIHYQLVYTDNWMDSTTYVFSDLLEDTTVTLVLEDNMQYYWGVIARDSDGFIVGSNDNTPNTLVVGTLSLDSAMLPTEFTLHQNYPNPFNPTTQIKYDLPSDSYVNISIYDVMGRKIKSLFNNNQTSGYHSLRWDATNDIGEGVSAGMYIYTIQAGEYRSTKKMVLLK